MILANFLTTIKAQNEKKHTGLNYAENKKELKCPASALLWILLH